MDRPSPLRRAGRLYQTVRHLRPVQVYARIWFRLYRPRVNVRGLPPLQLPQGRWIRGADHRSSMIGPDRFRFLNEEGLASTPGDWNCPERDKLWLYNLHYFDDLNAHGAGGRNGWHRSLIARWVMENPPFAGNGWEPYPLSLRIVNWLKWVLTGNAPDPAWTNSLALQARFLRRRLEHHLLGNHLFANAKALFFAGLCFDGDEAQAWLDLALRLLEREVPEQVLADGGHFERSPMYHSIILEDILDMLNLLQTRGLAWDGDAGSRPVWRADAVVPAAAFADRLRVVAQSWIPVVQGMRHWLAAMSHPDGEIGLFNDAAFEIAASPARLEAYAVRLKLGALNPLGEGVVSLLASGYVRLQRGPAVLITDVGEIGPSYLPGHAHADTLSFELSLDGQRILVDSGTSLYGEGAERLRQRGTSAHNSISIEGRDSSEVWGGFRVAHRAHPRGLLVEEGPDRVRIACAHDGFRRLAGSPMHRRVWELGADRLVISDRIEGPFEAAVARFHLHPGVHIRVLEDGPRGLLERGGVRQIRWSVQGSEAVRVVESTYHPHFGVSEPSRCIEALCGGGPLELTLIWGS